MKTAAKVFIIIGMVFSGIAIYPIILGIFAIRALDCAKTHSELTSWGVVTLLFVSLLGGIFMLCVKDEDLKGNITNTTATQNKISYEGCTNQDSIDALNDLSSSKSDSLDQSTDNDNFILAVLFDEL